jgi:hypothetical protein
MNKTVLQIRPQALYFSLGDRPRSVKQYQGQIHKHFKGGE